VHTNIHNNKKYVGITSQEPDLRWLNGLGYARHLPMGRAVEKYGWDGFKHEIWADDLLHSQAQELECFLIKILNTQDDEYGYNLTDGGEGLCGFHHSDEAKKKMSDAKSGENHPNYGKHLSETTREKISQRVAGNKNALGCIRSEETKDKIAKSKMKKVVMCDKEKEICIFDSAKSAQEITGISRKNISLCCLGNRKKAGGYSWKFA